MGWRAALLVALAVGGMLLSGTPPAGAADWSVVPELRLSAEYDSNLSYAYQNKEGDFILRAMPSVDFSYASEVSQLTGRLGLTGLHYVKAPYRDKIDQNFQVSGRYLVLPRLSLSFSGSYILDSTIQEELTQSGFVITRTRLDEVVPLENAQAYLAALPGAKEYVAIEGADHTFSAHAWETQAIETTVRWLAGVLQP